MKKLYEGFHKFAPLIAFFVRNRCQSKAGGNIIIDQWRHTHGGLQHHKGCATLPEPFFRGKQKLLSRAGLLPVWQNGKPTDVTGVFIKHSKPDGANAFEMVVHRHKNRIAFHGKNDVLRRFSGGLGRLFHLNQKMIVGKSGFEDMLDEIGILFFCGPD